MKDIIKYIMKYIRIFFNLLSSMRAGLVILVAIGIMSALGSYFFPVDFYKSFLFKLLLLTLMLNMTLCTLKQLSGLRRVRFGKSSKRYFLRKSGILVLHAGLVLILIGGTVNSFYGQSAQIKIAEGDILPVSEVIARAGPFSIQLDRFRIDYNADGSVSQYYSDVSIIEGTEVTDKYSISVNNPLVYRGIKAYQSSYGYLIDLQGESSSGWSAKKTLPEKGIMEIQDSAKAVMVYKYIPDYDPAYGMNSKSLRPDNPRIIYSVYENGSLLDVGIASFQEKVEIEAGKIIRFNGLKTYTVLTLKRDPGLFLVAPGGLMLMLGACLALIIKTKKREDM